jgi:hypothetical protein
MTDGRGATALPALALLTVLSLALVGTVTADGAPTDGGPSVAGVAVTDVQTETAGTDRVYVVEYRAGVALRLDVLLFGSGDLETALRSTESLPSDARFRSLTMDRAVLVEGGPAR